MALAPPTRRELVIVTLLLVFLLLASSFRSDKQPSRPLHPYLGVDNNNISAAPAGVSHGGAPETLITRLSWGTSPVPQTKVLAHVPGQLSSPCDSVVQLLIPLLRLVNI